MYPDDSIGLRARPAASAPLRPGLFPGSKTVDLANPKPIPGLEHVDNMFRAAGGAIAGVAKQIPQMVRDGLRGDPNGLNRPQPQAAPSAPAKAAPAPAPAPAFEVSKRTPEAISADIAARPPITTPAGMRLLHPAPMPGVGVQGAAPAAGQPGVQVPQPPSSAGSEDRVLQSMLRQHDYLVKSGPVGQGSSLQDLHDQHAARVLASGSAIGNYRLGVAQAAEKDPRSSIGVIDAINADPARRGTYLAGRGVDAGTIGNLPRPGFPGEPVNAAGHFDPAAAAGLADDSVGLLDQSRRFSTMPGAGDPNHANHAVFQDWINKRYAGGNQWDEDTAVPPGYDDYQFAGPSFLAPLAKGWATASQAMFGPNRRDRVEQSELLKRMQIQAPPGTVSAPFNGAY